MLYLKADGITVIQYPYSRANLQADNPNTSFPAIPSEEVYVDFGASVVTVVSPPSYDPMTENLDELTPQLIGSDWTQAWSVTPATPEEIAARQEQSALQLKYSLAGYYDSVAQTEGFADRNACVARAGYSGLQQGHGIAFGLWMDDCNDIVLANPSMAYEDLIALFPPIVWPPTPVVYAP